MPKCTVVGCKTGYKGQIKGLQCFTLPKSKHLQELWLKKINRENFTPSRYTVVCERHFNVTDCVPDSENLGYRGKPRKMRKLKPTAIPSKFLVPNTDYKPRRKSEEKNNSSNIQDLQPCVIKILPKLEIIADDKKVENVVKNEDPFETEGSSIVIDHSFSLNHTVKYTRSEDEVKCIVENNSGSILDDNPGSILDDNSESILKNDSEPMVEDDSESKVEEANLHCQKIEISFENGNPWNVSSAAEFLKYCCPECDFKTVELDGFSKHATMKHVLSNLLFTNNSDDLSEFNEDFEAKVNKKANKCPICDKIFSWAKYLPRHLLNVHQKSVVIAEQNEIKNKMVHKCSICDKIFPKPSRLKRHTESVHDGFKPFACTLCDSKFSEKRHMKRHIKTVHEGKKPEKAYLCSTCGNGYSCQRDLKRHIATIHEGLKLSKLQNENFFTKFAEKHKIKRYSDTVEVNDGMVESNKIEIDKSLEDSALEGKENKEEENCAYECPACKSVLSTKRSFYTHVRQSCRVTGKGKRKSAPCEKCGKVFSTNTKLRIHMKRDHLNAEATHHCVPCGKHFVDIRELKHHNYQSHSEREKCLKCEKTFLTKFILKKHLVFDHNIKDGALFCDRCPKKVFFKEAILEVHLKTKHNIPPN